jgi:transcriptional regulator with XRE-family HTH domain
MADEGTAIVAEGFGENLRRVRRREGLSLERLGRRASLHRTVVGLLERGGRACRIDTLLRVAGALDVRPEELLVGIAWIPGPETTGTFTHTSGQPSSSEPNNKAEIATKSAKAPLR